MYFSVHRHAFALRGVEEQYSLVPNQFIHFTPDSKICEADIYYEYSEFVSKINNQHQYNEK